MADLILPPDAKSEAEYLERVAAGKESMIVVRYGSHTHNGKEAPPEMKAKLDRLLSDAMKVSDNKA
jgi:hypothetical protein